MILLIQFLGLTTFALILVYRTYRYKHAYVKNVPVVTEFTSPPDIDPIMCGVLRDGRLNSEDITAGIVTLVQKGVLAITPVSNGRDYQISYERELETAATEQYYVDLLHMLFLTPKVGSTVLLSSITSNKRVKIRNFYLFRRIKNHLFYKLAKLGYFEELSMDAVFKGTILRLLVALLVITLLQVIITALYVVMPSYVAPAEVNIIVVLLFFVVSFIDIAFRWYRLTSTGAEVKYKLEGLYQYLSVAEHDRYQSETALNEDILAVHEYLPYAIAFGLVSAWNKAFSNIRSTTDEKGRR